MYEFIQRNTWILWVAAGILIGAGINVAHSQEYPSQQTRTGQLYEFTNKWNRMNDEGIKFAICIARNGIKFGFGPVQRQHGIPWQSEEADKIMWEHCSEQFQRLQKAAADVSRVGKL